MTDPTVGELSEGAVLGRILSRLAPAFDAGLLTSPTAITERPLARGVETYADLSHGMRGKFVFMND